MNEQWRRIAEITGLPMRIAQAISRLELPEVTMAEVQRSSGRAISAIDQRRMEVAEVIVEELKR